MMTIEEAEGPVGIVLVPFVPCVARAFVGGATMAERGELGFTISVADIFLSNASPSLRRL